MADDFPSSTEPPQNQNELENEEEEEPIFIDNEVQIDDEEDPFFHEYELDNEDEEPPIFLSDEDDEEYEYEDNTSFTESLSELDSESEEDDEDEESEDCSFGDEDDEACSLGDEGGSDAKEGNEWGPTQIDGLFCPICMESWTNHGDHHISCLPCGHIYGMSCIQKWLKQCEKPGKCPQCNRKCTVKDVRKLFASRVVAVDEQAHKRIQSLENKCASLEKKRAKWRKAEAELQSEVQHLREVRDSDLAECKQQLAETQQQIEHLIRFLTPQYPDLPKISWLSAPPPPPQIHRCRHPMNPIRLFVIYVPD